MKYHKKLNYHRQKVIVFSLAKIYFASDDGSQNMFAFQPTLNGLELKKKKKRELNMLLIENQEGYIFLIYLEQLEYIYTYSITCCFFTQHKTF